MSPYAPDSIEHAGRELHEVVGSEAMVGKRSGEPAAPTPAVQIPGMWTGDEESSLTDTEADVLEEHLRGVGYLG